MHHRDVTTVCLVDRFTTEETLQPTNTPAPTCIVVAVASHMLRIYSLSLSLLLSPWSSVICRNILRLLFEVLLFFGGENDDE